MNNCKKCGKDTTNPKFCSRSCSVSYTNIGVRRHGGKPVQCLYCGTKLQSSRRKYCTRKCMNQHHYDRYVSMWKSGEVPITRFGKATFSLGTIRKFLFQENNSSCSKCGWSEINPTTGKVPLQIHHKNGKYRDNRYLNLELLCPNCHSLTGNFGKLNEGNGRRKH